MHKSVNINVSLDVQIYTTSKIIDAVKRYFNQEFPI